MRKNKEFNNLNLKLKIIKEKYQIYKIELVMLIK